MNIPKGWQQDDEAHRPAQCNCSMRTRLVGDGCEKCNPAQTIEYLREGVADLEREVEALLAAAPSMPAQQDDEALEVLRQLITAFEMSPGLRKTIRVSRLLDDARALLTKRGEK